jgi:nitrile hydratase accessory protein
MSSLPPDPRADAPTFDAPWQARAFALAVALTDEDDLPWDEFQRRLVEEVDADRETGEDADDVYYRQWLAALERLMVERDLLDPGELTDRIGEFEGGDRSAHEFVDGDPHAHACNLPEGHAEGSDHGHGHGHGHDHAHDHAHGHGHSH